MKSQSTIIGRVFSKQPLQSKEKSGSTWKDIKYWYRRNPEPLLALLFVLVIVGGGIGLSINIDNSVNDKISEYAQKYHYTVGQKVYCNMAKYPNSQQRGWQKCVVTAVSKDNRRVTTKFYDDEIHNYANYTFDNPSIGVDK